MSYLIKNLSLLRNYEHPVLNKSRIISLTSVFKTGNRTVSYDHDGKTVATKMNKKELADKKFLVEAFTMEGLRLVNGVYTYGPTILFPSNILAWNIRDEEMINENSLMLFFHIHPKLDLLIIGWGDKTKAPAAMKNIAHLSLKYKMSIEYMPTRHALGTYNYLVMEDRHVAGAFIPPLEISYTEDDVARTKHYHGYESGVSIYDGQYINM